MKVKLVFNYLWGGKPDKETYDNVDRIVTESSTSNYSTATLYFTNGKKKVIDYSSMKVEK